MISPTTRDNVRVATVIRVRLSFRYAYLFAHFHSDNIHDGVVRIQPRKLPLNDTVYDFWQVNDQEKEDYISLFDDIRAQVHETKATLIEFVPVFDI